MQEYYTVNEAAKLLRVQPNTVYRWIRAGKLDRVKLASGGVRIPAAALSVFLGGIMDEKQEPPVWEFIEDV